MIFPSSNGGQIVNRKSNSAELDDVPENFGEGLRRRPVGVDAVDDFLAVKIQHRLGFVLVSLEPRADDLDVRVVQAVVLERAALHPRDEVFEIAAAHVKNGDDVDKLAEHFRLMHAARNAVEDERVAFGMKPPGGREAVRELLPQLDGRLVGHKLAGAGVFDENFSERRFGTQVAEHVAATAMDAARNRAEDFSVRAFAGTRRAEHENGAVFQAAFGLSLIS